MQGSKTLRGILPTLLALALILVISGCGAGAAEPSTPDDTLVVALEAEPPELDPSFSSAYVDRQVMASIFDKLVDTDRSGKVVPMLARSYEVSDDGLIYTFKLREGVKFHDGTDLDAEAVKFNFERYQEEDSVRSTEIQDIESVEVGDPLTVRVRLKRPFAPFLTVLADRAGIIASPRSIRRSEDGRISENPVGTGPYRFVERRRGQSITVERNEDYWGERPVMRRIEYRGIEDGNVQLQSFRSGEMDIIDQIPPVEVENLREEGIYTVSTQTGLGYQGIHLNTTRPPLDDPDLRRAVAAMVNRKAIGQAVLRGVGGEPGNSAFSPDSFAYGESDDFDAPNVAEAREYLKRAGRPDGFSFTLKIGPSPDNEQLGLVFQNTLEPAGIEVELERVEFGTLLEQAAGSDFEALFLGWSGRVDPDQNTYDFLKTGTDNNYVGYSNPEVDRLLDEARQSNDRSERKRLYERVMEIVHEDAPYLYLYHQANDFALQGNIEGFEPYPDGILRLSRVGKGGGGE